MSDKKKLETKGMAEVPLAARVSVATALLGATYQQLQGSLGEDAALLALIVGGRGAREHLEEKHPDLREERAKFERAFDEKKNEELAVTEVKS